MTFHRLRAENSVAMDPLTVVPTESRPSHSDRPWVFTNMAATLDGATAVDGVSGAIGDDDDHAMFRALRASADVILVGSRTANVEAYRPPQRSDAVDRARSEAGRAPRPLVAVVSASLSIDPAANTWISAGPCAISSRPATERSSARVGRRSTVN